MELREKRVLNCQKSEWSKVKLTSGKKNKKQNELAKYRSNYLYFVKGRRKK